MTAVTMFTTFLALVFGMLLSALEECRLMSKSAYVLLVIAAALHLGRCSIKFRGRIVDWVGLIAALVIVIVSAAGLLYD